MPTYRIESLFYYNNLKCCVILGSLGHRCGYVGVPPEHPLYNVDYNTNLNNPELLQEIKNSPSGKRSIISLFCWDGEDVSPGILFNVHGGITYSGTSNKYPTLQIDPIWWFGFDCGHYGDGKDWEAVKKYFLPKEWEYLYKIDSLYFDDSQIRSKEYVEDECRSLVEQLVYVGKVLKEYKKFMATLREMNEV